MGIVVLIFVPAVSAELLLVCLQYRRVFDDHVCAHRQVGSRREGSGRLFLTTDLPTDVVKTAREKSRLG